MGGNGNGNDSMGVGKEWEKESRSVPVGCYNAASQANNTNRSTSGPFLEIP